MTLRDALGLGRVSNLPTVWTNTLAGLVLADGSLDLRLPLLLFALSLFYVGGMYLNDAFDAAVDATERPERPIPSGRVARSTVFTAGFVMLAVGVALLAAIGLRPGGTGPWPGLGGLALAAAIVLYDWHHKGNPLSPLLMGLCRLLVYVAAGLCYAVPLPAPVLLGGLLLLGYLIGLTYVAKQENIGQVSNMWPLLFLAAPLLFGAARVPGDPLVLPFLIALLAWVGVALRIIKRRGPGDIPRAVVGLIAGIALVDAVFIAAAGEPGLAVFALAGFGLTLLLQRFVPGT